MEINPTPEGLAQQEDLSLFAYNFLHLIQNSLQNLIAKSALPPINTPSSARKLKSVIVRHSRKKYVKSRTQLFNESDVPVAKPINSKPSLRKITCISSNINSTPAVSSCLSSELYTSNCITTEVTRCKKPKNFSPAVSNSPRDSATSLKISDLQEFPPINVLDQSPVQHTTPKISRNRPIKSSSQKQRKNARRKHVSLDTNSPNGVNTSTNADSSQIELRTESPQNPITGTVDRFTNNDHGMKNLSKINTLECVESNVNSIDIECVDAKKINVSKKKQLDNLSTVYSLLIIHNIVPDIYSEIKFILQILTLHPGNNSSKSDCDQPFGTVHHAVYFAVSCLEHLHKNNTVNVFDFATRCVLANHPKIREFSPYLSKCLLNSDQNESVGLLQRSTVQNVQFLEESDNRSNFNTEFLFRSFRKERDLFYGLLRDWTEGGQDNALTRRVYGLINKTLQPANMMPFCRLFVSQLIMSCSGNMDLSDSSKMKRLQDRLTNQQETKLEVFFECFVNTASSPVFNQHLLDNLGLSLKNKTDSFNLDCYHKDIHQQRRALLDHLDITRLLAKFMGFLRYLPYNPQIESSNSLFESCLQIRENEAPPSVLDDLATKPPITSFPAIVEFLQCADSVALHLPLYRPLLAALIDTYLRIPATLPGYFLSLSFGRLFEKVQFPGDLLVAGLSNRKHVCLGGTCLCKDSVEGVSLSWDAAYDVLVTPAFINHALPWLNPGLCKLLDRSPSGVKTRLHHLDVLLTKGDPAESPSLNIQDMLEEGFFHCQPPAVKRTVEYLTERLASNYLKEYRSKLMTSASNRVDRPGSCKDMSKKNIADYARDKCTLLVPNLLVLSDGVTATTQDIIVRSVVTRVENYLRKNVVPVIPESRAVPVPDTVAVWRDGIGVVIDDAVALLRRGNEKSFEFNEPNSGLAGSSDRELRHTLGIIGRLDDPVLHLKQADGRVADPRRHPGKSTQESADLVGHPKQSMQESGDLVGHPKQLVQESGDLVGHPKQPTQESGDLVCHPKQPAQESGDILGHPRQPAQESGDILGHPRQPAQGYGDILGHPRQPAQESGDILGHPRQPVEENIDSGILSLHPASHDMAPGNKPRFRDDVLPSSILCLMRIYINHHLDGVVEPRTATTKAGVPPTSVIDFGESQVSNMSEDRHVSNGNRRDAATDNAHAAAGTLTTGDTAMVDPHANLAHDMLADIFDRAVCGWTMYPEYFSPSTLKTVGRYLVQCWYICIIMSDRRIMIPRQLASLLAPHPFRLAGYLFLVQFLAQDVGRSLERLVTELRCLKAAWQRDSVDADPAS